MADTENSPQTDSGTGSTPPWGADFDAEKAWRLVQNLRSEVAEHKTAKDALKTELDRAKAATGSESEKIAEAEKRAVAAEKALYVEKALRKHPTLADYADLLSGDSEEDVLKKAERLAAIGKKPGEDSSAGEDGAKSANKADEAPAGKEGEANIPGKPTPALTPGHGGTEQAPFDPVAIAKAVRGNS